MAEATKKIGLRDVGVMQQFRVGGGALYDGAANNDGVVETTIPDTVVAAPWIEAPNGSYPLDPQNSIALPAVGASGTVVSYTVPDGFDAVIEYYSCNFTGPSFNQGSGDIAWQVQIDARPVRNLENITTEKGTIQQGRKLGSLRVFSGSIVSLSVSHAANAALSGNTVCSFTGYIYPSKGN